MDETRRARSFELASVAACEAIAKRDCIERGYSINQYCKHNLLSYYVGVNSWLILIEDYAGGAWFDVYRSMTKDGLLSVIEVFADAADDLIHGHPLPMGLVRDVLSQVAPNPRASRPNAIGYVPWDLSIRLQICRYLKRITFQHRADVEKAAKDGFYQTQLRLASTVIPGYRYFPELLDAVRAELADAVDWDTICSKIEGMDCRSRTFTTGAASDAGATFRGKLVAMAASNPEFFRPIMGSWLDEAAPSRQVEEQWIDEDYARLVGAGYLPDRHRYAVRISTAPKNVNGPRIIALEPVDKQTAQRFIKDILYRHFPAGIDLCDQSRNQEMAAEGSNNGRYATIDLSSASDYVTKALVQAIFPERFIRAIWRYLPTHYRLGGREFPLCSMATMGNGLTFWIESMTFWAIASSCVGTGEVTVYGDDIIVPSDVAPLVVEALTCLGFVVNKSKTFVEGPFRESCGVEYYAGLPTQAVYFPRFSLKGEITDHTCTFKDYTLRNNGEAEDTLLKAIQLQHRLSAVSLNASRFLTSVIEDACPEITTSPYGSVLSDLWGPGNFFGPGGWAPTGVVALDPSPTSQDGDTKKVFVDLPVERRPLVARRQTRFLPHTRVSQKEDPLKAINLLRHYVYWRFLERGPRPWAEGDGWLPDNATLPDTEAERLSAVSIEWGWTNL